MSSNGDWCVVRWMEGRTCDVLRERGSGSSLGRDPLTGATFCGPLAFDSMLEKAGLGKLGFPRGAVGAVARFATQTEAQACCHHDGSHIAIDIPTRVDELHFAVEEYDHWSGFTRILYDGGDLIRARVALMLRKDEIKELPGSGYLSPKVVCWPRPGRLTSRPSKEQAQRLYDKAVELSERRRASSDATSPPAQG